MKDLHYGGMQYRLLISLKCFNDPYLCNAALSFIYCHFLFEQNWLWFGHAAPELILHLNILLVHISPLLLSFKEMKKQSCLHFMQNSELNPLKPHCYREM